MGTGGSTQLSPLDFFLRSTRVSVPSKLYRRQMEHFSWQNLAVNVSQSPARFALGSWDVFAYDLLPNRLSPLGQVSSGQRQPITCALRAWFLGRFRTRGVRGFALRIRRPCESSPRHISTGRLHALRRFHSPPINLIVFEAPYRTAP